MSQSLQEIINRLWMTPDNAEWTRKTEEVSLTDIREWMASGDIEILGFTYHLLCAKRFRVQPPVSLAEYIEFTKLYYGRCLRENPEGDWSSSRYNAGSDLVNIFASLWRDSSVPRPVLDDLKAWLERLYRESDETVRTCVIQATLEHLFEQEQIREFFSDWQNDKVLAVAYREASEWYKHGGNSPLGKPPSVTG
jgi:hypothetical protein